MAEAGLTFDGVSGQEEVDELGAGADRIAPCLARVPEDLVAGSQARSNATGAARPGKFE